MVYNAVACIATVISYECKMFMKYAPARRSSHTSE